MGLIQRRCGLCLKPVVMVVQYREPGCAGLAEVSSAAETQLLE
jgi:hypothetical protein